MQQNNVKQWTTGDIIALRYISTDARIEMCWPCRVVEDTDEILAVFIAAGSKYKAGPKRSAAEKRQYQRDFLPPDEYEWRKDTLRLMFPGQHHSVFLFWKGNGANRQFESYFVNIEEPYRRTAVGIDTQDHTLDIVVQPDLSWEWRDEDELQNHVRHGFYTQDLAEFARAEGNRVIEQIKREIHPCLKNWDCWQSDPTWEIPTFPAGWDTTPITFWDRRKWAYGEDCFS